MSTPSTEDNQATLARERSTRGAHRGVVTKYINDANAIMANPTDQVSKQDFEALKVVLMHLDRKLITLNSINKTIEAITPDSSQVNEIEETEEKTANWQTAIYQISSFIGEVERHIAPAPLSQPQPSQSVQSKQVQLPKLELPTFSGKYVECSSFYDLFTASIDKNNSR